MASATPKRSFKTSFNTSFKSTKSSEKEEAILDPSFVINSDDYEIFANESLGEGGSATVFKGRFRERDVAVKKFPLGNTKLPPNRKLLLREAADLVKLRHPNIIQCFGVCIENASLILEYASQAITFGEEGIEIEVHSMRQLLDTVKEEFQYGLKLEAMYQICEGLAYLHSLGMVHGDLKSNNVLITSDPSEGDFIFKLCDLGSAHSMLTSKLSTNISVGKSAHRQRRGTVSFEAPEVFTESKKTSESDIFSFGMVMIELLFPCNAHPWAVVFPVGSSDSISARIIAAVTKGERPPVRLKNPYVDLMELCWQQNPKHRPSTTVLKNHILILQESCAEFGTPQPSSAKKLSGVISKESPLKLAHREWANNDLTAVLNKESNSHNHQITPEVAVATTPCHNQSIILQSQESNTRRKLDFDDRNGTNNNNIYIAENASFQKEQHPIHTSSPIPSKNGHELEDGTTSIRSEPSLGTFDQRADSSAEESPENQQLTSLPQETDEIETNSLSANPTETLTTFNEEEDIGFQEVAFQGDPSHPAQPRDENQKVDSLENIEMTDDTLLSINGNVSTAEIQKISLKEFREREMAFQGYAGTHLNIQLKPFQITALHAFSENKDSLIIQATGSGKSACFQVPALTLEPHEYGIIIVPTLSLGEDHYSNFEQLKIPSVFLKQGREKEIDFAFQKTGPNPLRPFPKVIIVTPEMLLGAEKNAGIIKKVDRKCLKFIAIDETHLVIEWRDFRPAFKKIKQLRDKFKCPIIALTATLKPANLASLKETILRNPVVVKGSIDRPNVVLKTHFYKVSKPRNNQGAKASKSKSTAAVENPKTMANKWNETAKIIINLVQQQIAIVYCAYSLDCDLLCGSLLSLGIKAACYTGKDTRNDKTEIYLQMKNEEIQILVATKAFGMVVNLPGIRHVIQVGLPENLSLWMQEIGRAGRDGNEAFAHLLVCENEDVGRLRYWTKSITMLQLERESRIQDFIDVIEFFSQAFIGSCFRSFLSRYFEDACVAEAPVDRLDSQCCVGCDVRSALPLQEVPLIVSALQTIHLLSSKLDNVHQTAINIIFLSHSIPCSCLLILFSFLSRMDDSMCKSKNWTGRYFNGADLKKQTSYGVLSGVPFDNAATTIRSILKQCLALKYVTLNFYYIDIGSTWAKQWTVTELGIRILNGAEPCPKLPDPFSSSGIIFGDDESALKNPTAPVEKKKRSRGKKGLDIVSKTIQLMKDSTTWSPYQKQEQYTMLGFHHQTDQLIYIEDFKKLKCCPHPIEYDYIWTDINLSKCSSVDVKEFVLEEGKNQPVYELRRAKCKGVKVCTGVNEDNKPCTFAVVNRNSENKCMDHPKGLLKETGSCQDFFVYIRRKDDRDEAAKAKDESTIYNQRWIGFLSNSTRLASHNHPEPLPSKLGAKLSGDIAKAIAVDPTLTSRRIAKGNGIGYNPIGLSYAAAKKSTLANSVNKVKYDVSGEGVQKLVEDFETHSKKRIDDGDTAVSLNLELDKAVLEKCDPYIRTFEFGDDFKMVILQTPLMAEVLSFAQFVQADVTFPSNSTFKYLLNIVTFNEESMVFQVVARVMLNRLTAAAYKKAFGEVFKITTALHPYFDNGSKVEAWIVDFSLAQRDGLAANLGKKTARARIVGCKVHYQRNVRKMAQKVGGSNASSVDLFCKITYMIPELLDESLVDLAFGVLCGETSIEEEENLPLLETLGLTAADLDVDTSKWSCATSWVKWWSKPSVLKMFTKSCTEMTDEEWESCPKTTNAVESHNKICQTNSTVFSNMLENFYCIDKNNVYEVMAARRGVVAGISKRKRNERNEKRRATKRIKPTTPGEADSDPNIGRRVWIDTEVETKKYGWCEATIEDKNDDGDYVARYTRFEGYITTLSDLEDEAVSFVQPIDLNAP